jgi:hypothetical protein
MFSETYRAMNDALEPSPALRARTLAGLHRRPRRSPVRAAAIAAALAVCLSTPALAVRTEPGYQLLYALSPAAAQFFQPVRRACTDQGVTMEVAGVRVAGDTAQAYVTLSGGAVDETTDLFDSWSFHLPFDQTGRCERVGWDEETGTVTFLCTTRTLDGSPIPQGGKMTFSVRRLLTGKETLENAAVELDLASCAREAETAVLWDPEGPPEPMGARCFQTGGNGPSVMLLPGAVLAEPAQGLAITAAGYADGLFHIQLCRGDAAQLDNHARLWLEDADGTPRTAAMSYFTSEVDGVRTDYIDFIFDLPSEELGRSTLHGDFYTSSVRTDGLWRVTFPLEDT